LFGTLGTILKWAVLLPLFLVIVLLAVANVQSVTVHLNPFDPDDRVLRIDLALYQLAFVIFALGAIVGALVAWSSRYRTQRRAQTRNDTAKPRQEHSRALQSRPVEQRPSGAFLPRPERG
jgi:hypothetical protein